MSQYKVRYENDIVPKADIQGRLRNLHTTKVIESSGPKKFIDVEKHSFQHPIYYDKIQNETGKFIKANTK